MIKHGNGDRDRKSAYPKAVGEGCPKERQLVNMSPADRVAGMIAEAVGRSPRERGTARLAAALGGASPLNEGPGDVA